MPLLSDRQERHFSLSDNDNNYLFLIRKYISAIKLKLITTKINLYGLSTKDEINCNSNTAINNPNAIFLFFIIFNMLY